MKLYVTSLVGAIGFWMCFASAMTPTSLDNYLSERESSGLVFTDKVKPENACVSNSYDNSDSISLDSSDSLISKTLESSIGKEDKFRVSPVATLLMDGGLFVSPQKSDFPDGVSIADVRLGVKMSYGKWSAKIEASYAFGKVVLKDTWLQYAFNERNQLRIGLQMQHFGYQNSTPSAQKVTMIEPLSNSVFNEPQIIGLHWLHSADKYFITAGAHVEPKASSVLLGKDDMRRQGYGIRARLLYRPYHSDGMMLQAGISGAFQSPQYGKNSSGNDTHSSFSFNANFPTKITLVSAVGATVDYAKNLWKITPELMGCYGRVALESQYYFQRVNRSSGNPSYCAYGAYATLRGLLIGRSYKYNMDLAGISTPGRGSLEGVLSYNYTNLSDSGASIFGGRVNDLSLGLNYYFNKYITGKIRYSYTHRWDRSDAPTIDFSAIQVRLQLLF